MDEARFWALIDESRRRCDNRSDDEERWQPAALESLLVELEPEEIEGFAEIFGELHARAYRWDLWHAAYVIQGGCSDDGFTDFRSGLIGLGREVYENALRDPLTLAQLSRDVLPISQEGLAYAAMNAYEALTGEELEISGGDDAKPAGERLDRDTIYRVYAELERKLGPR